MYGCMDACMYVCMYVCIYVCMNVCVYAYMYIYVCIIYRGELFGGDVLPKIGGGIFRGNCPGKLSYIPIL